MSDSELKLDFRELDSNMIERDIKARYKLNWYCKPDNSLPDLGDYICFDELKTWNEIPAFLTVFWFKNGKLNAAKVDFPIWYHQKLVNHLKKVYGRPLDISETRNNAKLAKNIALLVLSKGKYKTDANISEDEFAVWHLNYQALFSTSLDSDMNPLSHNTILWQAHQ